jgi:hypothetical protein
MKQEVSPASAYRVLRYRRLLDYWSAFTLELTTAKLTRPSEGLVGFIVIFERVNYFLGIVSFPAVRAPKALFQFKVDLSFNRYQFHLPSEYVQIIHYVWCKSQDKWQNSNELKSVSIDNIAESWRFWLQKNIKGGKAMRKMICFGAVFMSLFVKQARAFTGQAPDAYMYFLYDFAINNIIKGPIGFVAGLVCIAMGARQAIHYNFAAPGPPYYGLSTWVPLSCFVWWLAAGFLLNADSMLVALGVLV